MFLEEKRNMEGTCFSSFSTLKKYCFALRVFFEQKHSNLTANQGVCAVCVKARFRKRSHACMCNLLEKLISQHVCCLSALIVVFVFGK